MLHHLCQTRPVRICSVAREKSWVLHALKRAAPSSTSRSTLASGAFRFEALSRLGQRQGKCAPSGRLELVPRYRSRCARWNAWDRSELQSPRDRRFIMLTEILIGSRKVSTSKKTTMSRKRRRVWCLKHKVARAVDKCCLLLCVCAP
jgi:hypothetical protein